MSGEGFRREQRQAEARRSAPAYLFEEDAGLRGARSSFTAAEVRAADETLVASWELGRGEWNPDRNPPCRRDDGGMLVLDGLILCEVRVGPRSSGELFGPGDLLWTSDSQLDGQPTLVSRRTWRVLVPSRVVVLERAVIGRIGRLPGVTACLQRRLADQARSLNVRLAIVQIPRLATRLQLLLWHLADRWGRTCSDGAVIPHRISQQVLAELVSAQRTSVGAALHELQDSGAVRRDERGRWAVLTQPPSEFT